MVKSLATKEAARQQKATTTRNICALAALLAACARRASLRWPPTRPTIACTVATASASQVAKWPISPIIASSSAQRGGAGRRRRIHRVPGLAQRLGRLRRHVVLVVLGEHLGGGEHAVRPDAALRDDTLALAEEVRQAAGVGHRDRLRIVGDAEGHAGAVALQAARLHQAADAEAASARCLVLRHLRRRKEEDDVAV